MAKIGFGWASQCISSQLAVLLGQKGDCAMCFHHSEFLAQACSMVAASFKERAWKGACLLGPSLRIDATFPLWVKTNQKASSNLKGSKIAPSWWEMPQSYIGKRHGQHEGNDGTNYPNQPIGSYAQEENWMVVVLHFLTFPLFLFSGPYPYEPVN